MEAIAESDAFLAIITEHFVVEPERYEECVIAEKMGKTMIALVKEDVSWEKFKRFPWVEVVVFKDVEKDREKIVRAIRRLRKRLEQAEKAKVSDTSANVYVGG